METQSKEIFLFIHSLRVSFDFTWERDHQSIEGQGREKDSSSEMNRESFSLPLLFFRSTTFYYFLSQFLDFREYSLSRMTWPDEWIGLCFFSSCSPQNNDQSWSPVPSRSCYDEDSFLFCVLSFIEKSPYIPPSMMHSLTKHIHMQLKIVFRKNEETSFLRRHCKNQGRKNEWNKALWRNHSLWSGSSNLVLVLREQVKKVHWPDSKTMISFSLLSFPPPVVAPPSWSLPLYLIPWFIRKAFIAWTGIVWWDADVVFVHEASFYFIHRLKHVTEQYMAWLHVVHTKTTDRQSNRREITCKQTDHSNSLFTTFLPSFSSCYMSGKESLKRRRKR